MPTLGAAPSKDTLWSTANNHTAIPGCPWTDDHEDSAAELHVVLAGMSTGPVGISDSIGNTNATLLKRLIMKDGTLLKPRKAITAVDSTFLEESSPILALGTADEGQAGGFVYGTAGVGASWHFVSFLLPKAYNVKLRDFWPPPHSNHDSGRMMFAYRSFGEGLGCQEGKDALSSGCVQFATVESDPSSAIFEVPEAETSTITPGQLLYTPTVTSVWQSCPESRWILLGELNKYVHLSPQRFQFLECTRTGVSFSIRGSPGEVVELTALRPEGGPLSSLSGQDQHRYTVEKKTIHLPQAKVLLVQFESESITADI